MRGRGGDQAVNKTIAHAVEKLKDNTSAEQNLHYYIALNSGAALIASLAEAHCKKIVAKALTHSNQQ